MIYNTTMLAEGTNIMHWLLVVNSWTGGALGGTFIVGGVAVSFAISRWFDVDTEVAIASSCFIWGLIATLLWAVQWNGLRFVPTLFPILLFAGCGIALFARSIKGWMISQ